jgi:hypothetical protein
MKIKHAYAHQPFQPKIKKEKGLVRISASCFRWYMDEIYVSLLNIIAQKVVPHFYMFGSGVKHEVFGNTNGTRAITYERYMGTLLTKVTQRVCDPKQL